MLTKCSFALIALCGLAAVAVFPRSVAAQGDSTELEISALKKMIENMGYTTKELSAETGKFEFTLKSGTLDVPIALEVSSSKRFVWLTVFVGEKDKMSGYEARAVKMLNQNFKIQPTNFYVTDKGNVMLGLAIDNRAITPAILRLRIDKIAADTASTESVWSGE